jgi:hypothetical protein
MSSSIDTILERKKKSFSKEEDELIISFVNENGKNCIHNIVFVLPNRTARQVRERYRLYLDPNINHNSFSFEEDDKLMRLANQSPRK